MKYSLFFLILGTLQAIASVGYSQTTKFTLDMKNATIAQVIAQIEHDSQFYFTYNTREINPERKVSVNLKEMDINAALKQMFAGENVNYLIVDKHVVLYKDNEITCKGSVQQGISVTGAVVNASGEPMPGVNVLVKGTLTGVVSDHNGSYSITVPNKEAVLLFSFVGYITEEFLVGDQTEINVILDESTLEIEEVVVVSYGTQKKRNVTGSIFSLKGDETRDKPVAQFAQALQGKVSGVQIYQNNGRPGEGMTFRIRGAGSIQSGSNSPLFVVDGLPVVGEINNISPDEIESYSILKDAAASALYGSRAANGVVLITTKKGQAGRTTIDFAANVGIQKIPERGRPDLMNGTEYATWKRNYYEDMIRYVGWTNPATGKPEVPEEFRNPEQYGEGTDWFSHLTCNAPIQNYSISIMSGNEKLRVGAVAAYMNQQGVLLNTEFERFNFRLNTEYKLNNHISFGANLAPSFRMQENHADSGWNIIGSAILAPPIVPFKNSDGTYPRKLLVPGSIEQPHPYVMLTERINEFKGTRLLGNAYVVIDFLKDFQFKSAFSMDTESANHRVFTPMEAAGGIMTIGTKSTGFYNSGFYTSWLSENTLRYDANFGNHHFEVLAGTTVQKYHWEGSGLDAEDYASDDYPWPTQAKTTKMGSEGANAPQEWAILSYLARLNYNFKEKYLLQVAVRRDGCSRFGQDNRWGTFPSVSAGWIISEESFMKGINVLNYLKLRSSYGVTGNNNIGNYTYYASVAKADYVMSDQILSGTYLNNLENKMLGWESNVQFDLGVDIGLFKDRIYIQADYWLKHTKDMLYNVSLPISSGYGSSMSNIGKIKFWGFDFDVDSKNLVGKFKWNTNLNITFLKNKVLDLGPITQPIGGYDDYASWNRIEIGQPIGFFYGYIYDGVYMNQAEFDKGPRYADFDQSRASQVGSVRMKDTNGDGIVTRDDRTKIGDPNPDFIFGLTNEFQYNNWDLSFVLSGSYGNDLVYLTLGDIWNLDGAFNMDKQLLNCWRSEENPGDGYVSRAAGTPGTTYLSRDKSTHFIHDGSHITMKNLTLGYTIKGIKFISDLRIYGSCQNLFTLTKYPGPSPEASLNGNNSTALGIDYSVYPSTRVFSLGVNLRF